MVKVRNTHRTDEEFQNIDGNFLNELNKIISIPTKPMIPKMKNYYDGLNISEEEICELKSRLIQTILKETKRKKQKEKN